MPGYISLKKSLKSSSTWVVLRLRRIALISLIDGTFLPLARYSENCLNRAAFTMALDDPKLEDNKKNYFEINQNFIIVILLISI